MKKPIVLTCLVLFLFLSGSAFASISFNLDGYESFEYDHSYAKGVDAGNIYSNQLSLKDAFAQKNVTSATLRIEGLTYHPYNNTPCTSFYLQLLNDGGEFWYNNGGWKRFDQASGFGGAGIYYSGNSQVNSFQAANNGNGIGTFLTNFGNVSTTGAEYTYTFSANSQELSALKEYLNNNGYFGLGFDPHCYYTYNGIYLDLNTGPGTAAPEPATMVLFGMGLVGFAAVARKKLPNKK